MKEQVIVEVSIVPVGTPASGLGSYVAACLQILKDASDIRYQLTAMGTIIEGPLERVLELVGHMHEVPFKMGAPVPKEYVPA